MTLNLLRSLVLATILFSLYSCSSESSESSNLTAKSQNIANYNYSPIETEVLKLINNHRVSIGLNRLEVINYISSKSEDHSLYMISNNDISHDNFVVRSESIISQLGAKAVGENVAFNFISAQSVFNAWLSSPVHKKNIEGNFTHFGIAIRQSNTTDRKFYTNIFAKI